MHVDDLLGAENLAAEAGDAVLAEADGGQLLRGVEPGQGDRVWRRLHVDDVRRAHDVADAAAGAFRNVDVLDHSPFFVMAGHSRSKNGVAPLAYVPAIHALPSGKDVDARHKAGHDDFTQTDKRLEQRQLPVLGLAARQVARLLAQQLALDVG
jgi:hypothetical protein